MNDTTLICNCREPLCLGYSADPDTKLTFNPITLTYQTEEELYSKHIEYYKEIDFCVIIWDKCVCIYNSMGDFLYLKDKRNPFIIYEIVDTIPKINLDIIYNYWRLLNE